MIGSSVSGRSYSVLFIFGCLQIEDPGD